MLQDILFNDGIFIKLEKRFKNFLNSDCFCFQCEKYHRNNSYPFILPKTYDDEEDLAVKNWKDFLEKKPFKVDAQVNYSFKLIFFEKFFNIQCVRSAGPWSIGSSTIESSIQNAYIQMIDAAQHYIYIEVN